MTDHAPKTKRVLHREVLGDRFTTAFGDHGHCRRHPPDRVARQGRRDRDDASTSLLRQHLFDGELGEVQEAFTLIDTSDLTSSTV